MEFNLVAIVLSVTINLIKQNSAKIGSRIVSFIHWNKSSQTTLSDLTNELRSLIKERDAFNQIDEFAKYSLVQRKVNKVNDKIKEIKNEDTKDRMKMIMYIKATLMVLISLLSIGFIWYCYDKPVVDFSPSLELNYASDDQPNLFYPLNWLLSFSSMKKTNVIGFTFWLFITNRLIAIFANKFTLV